MESRPSNILGHLWDILRQSGTANSHLDTLNGRLFGESLPYPRAAPKNWNVTWPQPSWIVRRSSCSWDRVWLQ